MMIPKMYLKLSFYYSKWVLQAILPITAFQTVFQVVQILALLFSRTIPNFVVCFF